MNCSPGTGSRASQSTRAAKSPGEPLMGVKFVPTFPSKRHSKPFPFGSMPTPTSCAVTRSSNPPLDSSIGTNAKFVGLLMVTVGAVVS